MTTPDETPSPEPAQLKPAQPEPAQPEPAPQPPSAAEEARRKMREALERKRGVQHPDDAARRGGGVRGRAAGTARREFRRKSG